MKNVYYISALLFSFVTTYSQEITDPIICTVTKEKSKDHNNPQEIYSLSEVNPKPQYPKGIPAFIDEIKSAINTADNGAPTGFKARVFISFIVEIDGTLSTFKLLREPGYKFGKEVIEAAEKIDQKWQPGMYNGKQVRVSYAIPVLITVP